MPACLGAIRLLCDVASLCNDPSSVRDIASRVLERVCGANGWFGGCVHALDAFGEMRRVAVVIASPAPPEAEGLLAQMEGLLLGRVIRSSEPVWQRKDISEAGGRAFTGMCAPIRTNDSVVGALVLLSDSRPPPAEEIRSSIETVSTLLAGVIERRLLDRATAEASTEEQHRIGRHLHDSISQNLSGAALIGDGIARRLDAQGLDESASMRRVTGSIRSALTALRGITEGLIPAHLGDGGLHIAIERMARGVAERSETKVSVDGRPPSLPASVSRELFLISSEAVRNAVTHAEATLIKNALPVVE